jgi:hypothetical protein
MNAGKSRTLRDQECKVWDVATSEVPEGTHYRGLWPYPRFFSVPTSKNLNQRG